MRPFGTTSIGGVLVAALMGAAVASTTGGCATAKPVDREVETPAERVLVEGIRKYRRKQYSAAVEAFNKVREKYPYSRFVAEAELKLADTKYTQEEYSSAVSRYRSFIELHPDHEKVPYARFRIAQALYQQRPKSPFFMPPIYERDLASTRRAAKAYRRFLDAFPESKYADRAEKKLRELRHDLANHELYVAEFYFESNHPRGAAMRARYLLNHYKGLGFDAKALFLLARSNLQLDRRKRALDALQDLVEFHPDTKFARRAKRYLKRYADDRG
ncbi:MAG: outer membrane protein assembly factor BamD [Bradymonadaceae bacterium]